MSKQTFKENLKLFLKTVFISGVVILLVIIGFFAAGYLFAGGVRL